MCRLRILVVPILLMGLWASVYSQNTKLEEKKFLEKKFSEKKAPEKKIQSGSIPTVEVLGKSLEHWIKLIPNKDQSKSEAAIRMVCQFGPERAYQALPTILGRLRMHFVKKADLSVRVNAVIAVGYILGGYKDADPKFVKESVTLLRGFLNPRRPDAQNIVRLRALQALTAIGTRAKEAIEDVIVEVKDAETFETRQAAVVALGRIAVDKVAASPKLLNALYGALSEQEPVQVRLAAVQTLSALGGPLNPNLRVGWAKYLNHVAYKDSEPVVQIWAHLAVMSVVRTIDPERVNAIMPMVNNADPQVRLQAIQALGAMGKDARKAVPTLNKALLDPEPLVVAWSIWALQQMGTAAVAALPTLEEIRTDPMALPNFRKLAEEAIDQIHGKQTQDKKK